MDINKICTACNIKTYEDNYKKWRTVCKDCYNKKKRKNNIKKQLPNNNGGVMYRLTAEPSSYDFQIVVKHS